MHMHAYTSEGKAYVFAYCWAIQLEVFWSAKFMPNNSLARGAVPNVEIMNFIRNFKNIN